MSVLPIRDAELDALRVMDEGLGWGYDDECERGRRDGH